MKNDLVFLLLASLGRLKHTGSGINEDADPVPADADGEPALSETDAEGEPVRTAAGVSVLKNLDLVLVISLPVSTWTDANQCVTSLIPLMHEVS
jgi:hypothetical protein